MKGVAEFSRLHLSQVPAVIQLILLGVVIEKEEFTTYRSWAKSNHSI